MENSNPTNEVLGPHSPKKLPDTLNVLTILTFVGCGLSYIFSLLIYYFTSNAASTVEKMSQRGSSQEEIDMFLKSADNRNILLISGLVFTTLCLIGALRMRKFKKSGYFLYLIGEIAPIVVSAGLFGTISSGSPNSARSIIGMVTGIGIPVIFVILYSIQLKHLENN